MKSIVTLLVLIGGMSVIAQTQTQSPWNPTDTESREMITVWSKVVDDTYLHAVNKARKTGEQIDPDAEIEPFLQTLAHNPYFDVNREAKIHPGYRKYVERIAELRGWKLQPQNRAYDIAKGLIVLALISWFLAAWSRRVTRKTSIKPGVSRGPFYRFILLKMSWRILLVIAVFLTLIIISDTAANESDDETGRKIAASLPGLVLLCAVVVVVSSWKATKAHFASSLPNPSQ